MPLYSPGDEDFARYKDSYFDGYPGQWSHGDYWKINERGICFSMGRSDSALHNHGVRIGTAEIYSVVVALDFIVKHAHTSGVIRWSAVEPRPRGFRADLIIEIGGIYRAENFYQASDASRG